MPWGPEKQSLVSSAHPSIRVGQQASDPEGEDEMGAKDEKLSFDRRGSIPAEKTNKFPSWVKARAAGHAKSNDENEEEQEEEEEEEEEVEEKVEEEDDDDEEEEEEEGEEEEVKEEKK